MVRVDLVVAICADQQQMPHVRLGQQILEEVERRRVEPLKIIEKERQRMFRPSEDADEATEHAAGTALAPAAAQAQEPAAARR